MITIYHNNRCRKSRETLKLLEENGIEPQVVEYLKSPLSAEQIKSLSEKLDVKPSEMVRKGEIEYKEYLKGKDLSDDEWFEIIASHPKVLERPIVVKGEKAVIGRPPENVLKLI